MSKYPRYKKMGSVKHCEMRAIQRYGVDIGWSGRLEILNLIATDKSMYVSSSRGRAQIWDVVYKDINMRVMINSTRTKLITILPRSPESEKYPMDTLEKMQICLEIMRG